MQQEEIIWHYPIKTIEPKPTGKLKRMHFLGDADKYYMDEKYYVFNLIAGMFVPLYNCIPDATA